MDITDQDWEKVADHAQLNRIEVTLTKIYTHPDNNLEYNHYTRFTILPRSEVNQAEICASDLTNAVGTACDEYQELLDNLSNRRRVHLENVLLYGDKPN